MLYALISLAGILLTLTFVIGTHEAAHFLVARWFNIKVLRFSIGFGKALCTWHDKKGTEYVVGLIPLGGYVKMLDETEGTVAKAEQQFAFNRQPFYKKFLVVLAGPMTNILCALLLYWVIFMMGFVTIKPIIGTVNPRSIAAESGLVANQEIVSIDHHPTSTWSSILFRLIAHVGNQDHILIEVKNPTATTTEMHTLDISNWHLSGLTPDPLGSLGIMPYEPDVPLIIGVIEPQSPAAASPLQLGDKIIAVNHVAIKTWEALTNNIIKHPRATLTFTLIRAGHSINVPVTVGDQRNLWLHKSGYLGIGPHFVWPAALQHKIQYGPVLAMQHATLEITQFTYFNLLIFGKMLTGKLSLQSLGGPLTIFQTAGDALNSGFLSFIGFLAFLSVSLGIINLLPIPGLDGGHLFIQLIEFIFQRSLPVNVLMLLYRLGIIFILFILIQAITNDVLRLY